MCLSTVGDVYSSIGFRNLIKDDVLVVEWLWVSLYKYLIIGMRNHLWTLSCSKVQILRERHTIWKNSLPFFWKHLCQVRYIFWSLAYQVMIFYFYLLLSVTSLSFILLFSRVHAKLGEKHIDIKDMFFGNFVPKTKWPKYVMNPLLSNVKTKWCIFSNFLVLLRISKI